MQTTLKITVITATAVTAEAAPAKILPNQRTVQRTLLRMRNLITVIIKTTENAKGAGIWSCAFFHETLGTAYTG